MGDKHKSEIQKPVKNTLLSGASHGFPFENFQGSSLLIPVSQDSPSVLTDCAGDINKLDDKELTHHENLTQITEEVRMTTLENTSPPEESRNESQPISQVYTGIFSSFFGGGGQKKQESDLGQTQRSSDHPTPSSASSTSRSSSPFVTIPSIQSFSPVLHVPQTNSEPVKNEASIKSSGFSHSLDSPFSNIQMKSDQKQNFETVSFGNDRPPSMQHPPLGSIEPPKNIQTNQPGQSEVQNFFNQENKSAPSIGFINQSVTSNLEFESFYNDVPKTTATSAVLSKAQSAIDLPVGGNIAPPTGGMSPFFNPLQPQNFPNSSQFYRAGSADSFQPISSPSPGVPLAGPPLSSPAPPMASGIASRNYRRDHHKRLAYAPVPGLTSNTTVSSSYLQTSDNFQNFGSTSLSSSTLTSPSVPVNQPLPGSLSQPALNLSCGSSEANPPNNNPPSSGSTLQNFFTPQSFVPSTCTAHSVEAFPNTIASVSSVLPHPVTQSNTTHSSISSVAPFSVNQAPNFSPPSLPPIGSTYVVTSPAGHQSITSTKEHSAVSTLSSAPVERPPSPVVIPPSFNNLANLGNSGIIYRPAYHHWFYRIETKDSKENWQPFSMTDSLALEQAFHSETLTPTTVVATDGGRYDVNVTNRIRTSVYWEEDPKMVRRCSWFYKSRTETKLHPYDENIAYNLEEEYKKAVTTNTWNKKVDLPNGEYIVMNGVSSMALFQHDPQTPEGWEAEPDFSQTSTHRSKTVKRGMPDDFEIEDGESPNVDHLIFVVHGIGSVCDFNFRTIEEAVDVFRSKCLQLIKSHFQTLVEEGVVNRVEILPVSWHHELHGENTGVDKKLQSITLTSIPKFRNFTNDTLLDILFYTSPIYCQNIAQQVGRQVNALFAKFKARNPNFKGGVSLVGHSLGSLILFDILCHQKPPSPRVEHIKEDAKTSVVEHEVTTIVSPDRKKRSLNRTVSYVMGNAGTGQPQVEYPQFNFHPVAFFAMGSPIGMFVTVRGIDSLGLDFCLPTCSRFFNIFHPFDPVAYRIEALVNPDLTEIRPVLIPHHKGRKRMHLELKEMMARVGTVLKQRLVDSFGSTWNAVYQMAMIGRADDSLKEEVHKDFEKQLERQQSETFAQFISESFDTDFNAGRLNQGRRIDYVLQEAPYESFNEYVFALKSHVIYWESEDTMLLILKEIYGTMGIAADSQQTGSSGSQDDSTPSTTLQDPCSPSTSFGPPPTYGFK